MIGFNNLGNHGHLGNQMFQYAALRGIASNRGFDWCIPPKDSFGKSYNLRSNLYDCFKLNSLSNIGFVDGSIANEPSFQYNQYFFDNCPDNADLYGFFQTEKYFKHIKNNILNDFEFLDSIKKSAISFMKSFSSDETVSVHLRRTDYVDKKEFHVPPSMEYYNNAMSVFENAKFIIFSDDIKWCKEQEIFQNSNVIFSNAGDAYIDLCIMSMCTHNIIANSSYSWWASYLNTNTEKIVISPSRWFGTNINVNDLYLENWITLQS